MGRVAPGDPYDDLAEAVERGMVASEAEPGELRERYTITLGTWEAMIADLLGQLAADAGSARRALVSLLAPADLIGAWRQGPLVGTEATVAWLAVQRPEAVRRIARAPSVLALRGDDYLDLAEAAGGWALAGDGALDPARLRSRYAIDRMPWLRMVADLLGQIVADAGSIERASTVLAVPLASLAVWVRWLVSRGSPDAAYSRWPIAPIADMPEAVAYLDLAEAVERGAVAGDNAIDQPRVRDIYLVRLDSWARMTGELLGQIIADAGSIRSAAKVIDVPRSTLTQWVKQHRERGEFGS